MEQVWFVIGCCVIGAILLYMGYATRMVQEAWEKSREDVIVFDWSERLPSPQQIAYEQMLRWQELRQVWNEIDAEHH